MRRAIIAGNWKMHKTRPEAGTLAEKIIAGASDRAVEIIVCPPFTALDTVAQAIKGSPVFLGAQNVFWEEQGAYTGEVAPGMLVDLGCTYVIIGHSERRQYFHETNESVNRRVRASLSYQLRPIICVGETLSERESGRTDEIVVTQIRGAYDGLNAGEARDTVVAYEPVWAIGTGRASNGPDANRVCGVIRDTLGRIYGAETAAIIRILYGGSVKPQNMAEFAAQPHIDGALVGGASLNPEAFLDIIGATEKAVVKP